MEIKRNGSQPSQKGPTDCLIGAATSLFGDNQ
jgi:hypothetical protein